MARVSDRGRGREVEDATVDKTTKSMAFDFCFDGTVLTLCSFELMHLISLDITLHRSLVLSHLRYLRHSSTKVVQMEMRIVLFSEITVLCSRCNDEVNYRTKPMQEGRY